MERKSLEPPIEKGELAPKSPGKFVLILFDVIESCKLHRVAGVHETRPGVARRFGLHAVRKVDQGVFDFFDAVELRLFLGMSRIEIVANLVENAQMFTKEIPFSFGSMVALSRMVF